jgi:hypothetical protein
MVMRKRTRHPAHLHTHAGCGKHPLEPASVSCAACARRCCIRCAVPVRRQVLCIDCGMVIGGISTRRRVS